MNDATIQLKARRDVLLVIYKAVTFPDIGPASFKHQLEGGIVALDLAILAVELTQGN